MIRVTGTEGCVQVRVMPNASPGAACRPTKAEAAVAPR